jgi:hypothetical protein
MRRTVKAVRDMNEVQNDYEKHTDYYVSGLCISIVHFVKKITTQQLAIYNETK